MCTQYSFKQFPNWPWRISFTKFYFTFIRLPSHSWQVLNREICIGIHPPFSFVTKRACIRNWVALGKGNTIRSLVCRLLLPRFYKVDSNTHCLIRQNDNTRSLKKHSNLLRQTEWAYAHQYFIDWCQFVFWDQLSLENESMPKYYAIWRPKIRLQSIVQLWLL